MRVTRFASIGFLVALMSAAGLASTVAAQEGAAPVPTNLKEIQARYAGMPGLVEGRLSLPPLAAPTIATDEIGSGRTPEDFRGEEARPQSPLPESASERAADWNWSMCVWAAPDTFSNPRYYEDRMLERHGHERFGMLQPVASGARFFLTTPMLPYLMAVRPPCDREYTLGYYRPGSRVPGLFQRPPLECSAVLWESAVVSGLFIACP
jgi:hypothetical protein